MTPKRRQTTWRSSLPNCPKHIARKQVANDRSGRLRKKPRQDPQCLCPPWCPEDRNKGATNAMTVIASITHCRRQGADGWEYYRRVTVDGEAKAKFAPMKPYNRVGEQLSIMSISKNCQTVT